VPYGALVAIEPSTGRVLAYVSHSSADPAAGDVARDPAPPSASVFKLVTAAALLESGVEPTTSTCYGGGLHRLGLSDLADDPRRDRACATLEEAIGGSINAVIAKLADRHLDRARIDRYAQAFGFGHALPFDAETRPSAFDVPDERLEFARTTAGFWHMHMSPLHGALLAATIANGGVMPRASMIERIVDAKERVQYTFAPSAYRTVIPRATAKTLSHMMLATVTRGTARSAFHDPKGKPFLPGIAVAGKTGSLSDEKPYRAYSWWVGFAPEEAPEIAVAALVVNGPLWRIKSSFVAREALRYFLVEQKAKVAKQKSAPPPPPPAVSATPSTRAGADANAPAAPVQE
jgi:peptidoglycan glycosyltransferase